MSLYRNGKREDVISGEPGTINEKPSKATPIDADVLLIEDSADGYTQKKALLSAYPDKHTQGTDLGLDTGGTNPITAATAKAHVDDVTGNPHAVTAAQASAEPANANIQSHISDVTGNPHAVTLEQARTANNAVAGDIAMANNNVTGLPSTPGSGSSAASKDYVDGVAQGLAWQQPVIEYTDTPPGGTPATGARYVVEPTGTGAWAGHDNDVAIYNGAGWDFDTPTEGWALRDTTADNQLVYNGTAWVTFGSTITHNNTSGLQGGITAERYHLTAAEQALLAYINQDVKSGTSPTFNGVNISGIITGDVDQVHIISRKASAGTIPQFSPVYIVSWNPAGWLEVEAADASTAVSKMPCIGISESAITNGANSFVAISGVLSGLDTSTPGYAVGAELYVANGGGLTSTKPIGAATYMQKVAQVVRSHVSAGVVVVFGAGRVNDVPNHDQYSSKATPVAADTLVIEDSADSKNKKKITTASLRKDVDVLVPEYAGAVISRPGSNAAVDISAGHDATAVENFMRGEAVSATLQASSIIIMKRLPAGFTGWAASAIKYKNIVDGTPGSTGLTVKIYDTTGALVHTDTKQQNVAWTETTIADTDLSGGTFAAGGVFKIELLLEAQNSKGVQVGRITLTPAGT